MGGASTGWLGLAQAGERLKADLRAGRRAVAGRSRRLRCEWRGDLELSSVRRRPWADAGGRVAAASPPGGAPCEGVVPLIPADARPCMERATRDQPTTARAPHGDFACGEELNHLCTSSCFSMGTGSC